MKPYGREKKEKFPGKIDWHLKKYGYRNWWEARCNILPRTTLKQLWKKLFMNNIESN